MADRMDNQRPANDEGRYEDRSLARRDEERGLSRYGSGASPFELMRRFSEDVDRMFASFGFPSFSSLGWPSEGTRRALTRPTTTMGMTTWTPTVDVFTRGNDLVVSADLPGIKPEDVQVESEGNNLVIRGESRTEQENKEQNYWYSERSYGSFYRSIPLPQGVNTDSAQARFNNGVLEVTFPDAAKSLQPQRRRIEIQGADRPTTTTGEQPTTTGPNTTTGEQPTTTT